MSAVGGTLRSIWRFHRLLAGILVLEYALAFSIMLAAFGVLVARAQAIHETSGVDEHGLYVLQARGTHLPVHRFEIRDAGDRLAAVVGSGQVAMGSSLPFLGRSAQVMEVGLPQDRSHAPSVQANAYLGDAQLPQVLGLRLLHGRWFKPDEITLRYGEDTHLVVLSQALAERLFHADPAVGEQVEIAGQLHTVVGVMGSLAAPQYLGATRTMYTMLLPRVANGGNLLVIRHAGSADGLAPVLAALQASHGGQVHWSLSGYDGIRTRYFHADGMAVWALATVVLVVLITALCGILGLTTYWVAKRRPQIAVRRALGARRRDIERHFLLESALLVAPGLFLGGVISLGLGTRIVGAQSSASPVVWMLAMAVVGLLAMAVVYLSLRRWLRMQPVELMRAA